MTTKNIKQQQRTVEYTCWLGIDNGESDTVLTGRVYQMIYLNISVWLVAIRYADKTLYRYVVLRSWSISISCALLFSSAIIFGYLFLYYF